MKKRLERVLFTGVCLTSLAASARVAHASSADDAMADAQRTIAAASNGVPAVEAAITGAKSDERSPEARIADGELLLGGKDYDRAAGVFNQVIEKYPNHPTAYPDALFLLGETYYESKQYLSARRVYRQLVERGQERGFAIYQPRALARLIDVSLRTGDYAALDDVLARIGQLPSAAAGGELNYARGKGLLFAKKDYGGARSALGNVGPE